MEKSLDLSDDGTREGMLQHLELAAVMGTGRSFFPIYTIFAISAVVIIHPSVSRVVTVIWVSAYLIYTVIRTIATSLYHEDLHRESLSRVKDWRRFVFFPPLRMG